MALDEEEFKQEYNIAVSAAEKIAAPESRTAMLLVLKLIAELSDRIAELHADEGDDPNE